MTVVIDAAKHVTSFRFCYRTLKPGTGLIMLAHPRQASAHFVQAGAQAGVVNAPILIALFYGCHGTLIPRAGFGVLTRLQQAEPHFVQTVAQTAIVNTTIRIAFLLGCNRTLEPRTGLVKATDPTDGPSNRFAVSDGNR